MTPDSQGYLSHKQILVVMSGLMVGMFLSALDQSIVKRGVYVALAQHRALFTAGSGVTGLSANEALGGWVDLARVGLR